MTERIGHYEEMLVAIGTVALGLMAYVGSLVFGRENDFGRSPEPRDQGPANASARQRGAFMGIVGLSVLTAVTYTHVFRFYAICYAYACELEIATLDEPRLRMHSAIWMGMEASDGIARGSAALTFYGVGFYCVALSASAVFLFGHHLRRSFTACCAIFVLLGLMALLYVVPSVTWYLELAARGQTALGVAVDHQSSPAESKGDGANAPAREAAGGQGATPEGKQEAEPDATRPRP